MKKFFRKNKKWLTIVAVVLVTATVVGIVAASTNMIAQIGNSNIGGLRERNDDNLLDVANYEGYDGDKVNGVTISVDENGVITLDGEAKEDISLELGTFELASKSGDAETGYDFEFYLKGSLDGSLDSYYLEVTQEDYRLGINTSDKAMAAVSQTILGGEKTANFEVLLIVKKGTELNNVKIYPGAYEEADANFYA